MYCIIGSKENREILAISPNLINEYKGQFHIRYITLSVNFLRLNLFSIDFFFLFFSPLKIFFYNIF